jgi:hypothetical protein
MEWDPTGGSLEPPVLARDAFLGEIPMILTATAILAAAFASFDDKDDLGNAVKKFTDAKSYSFKGEVTVSAPGRGGDAPAPTPTAFDGKFAEDVGLVVQTAQDEIVKIGGRTAIRPKPVWRVMDDGTRGNRGPGLQAAFAGRGGGALAARAPKEDLTGLDGKLEKVTKTDKKETVGEGECSVFEVTFSPEGAKSLTGGAGRPGAGGGGGNATVTASASGHFWVTSDGRLAKYEITSKMSRTFNDREFTTSTSRTVSLFDIDKTKVELPAGAKEAIGQQ